VSVFVVGALLTASSQNKPTMSQRDEHNKDTQRSSRELDKAPSTSSTSAGGVLLEHTWVFYFDRRSPRGQEVHQYENSVRILGEFNTVQDFWRYWNNIDLNRLPINSNLRLFKKGIHPTWEDPKNVNGGKWIIEIDPAHTTQLWLYCILAMIGEQFEHSDSLCGTVLSIRMRCNGIALWNCDATATDVLEKTEDELRHFLKLSKFNDIRYQRHKDCIAINDHNRMATVKQKAPNSVVSAVSDRNSSPRRSSVDVIEGEEDDQFGSPFIELSQYRPHTPSATANNKVAKSPRLANTNSTPSVSLLSPSQNDDRALPFVRDSGGAASLSSSSSSSFYPASISTIAPALTQSPRTLSSTAAPSEFFSKDSHRSQSVGSLQHLYTLYNSVKMRHRQTRSATSQSLSDEYTQSPRLSRRHRRRGKRSPADTNSSSYDRSESECTASSAVKIVTSYYEEALEINAGSRDALSEERTTSFAAIPRGHRKASSTVATLPSHVMDSGRARRLTQQRAVYARVRHGQSMSVAGTSLTSSVSEHSSPTWAKTRRTRSRGSRGSRGSSSHHAINTHTPSSATGTDLRSGGGETAAVTVVATNDSQFAPDSNITTSVKNAKSLQVGGIPYQIVFIVFTLISVILFTLLYNIISHANFVLIRR